MTAFKFCFQIQLAPLQSGHRTGAAAADGSSGGVKVKRERCNSVDSGGSGRSGGSGWAVHSLPMFTR
jgi:hypothetical protein